MPIIRTRIESLVCLILLSAALPLLLSGCTTIGVGAAIGVETDSASSNPDKLRVINRLTWGVNATTLKHAEQIGLKNFIEEQLSRQLPLPDQVTEQINAMSISRRPVVGLVQDMEQQRKDADAIKEDEPKKKAQQAYQESMNQLSREAAGRTLLRAVYSPNQLHEQMVSFWMNHFSVHQSKHNLRAMVGDFEESAIRPHALGKFRDLLKATVFHPAMIRYLDNEQNAAKQLNENYARELMELHTLGIGGGYSQQDVQELARVLTGVGINLGTSTPAVRADLSAQYVRRGLFEFNPNRHDFGTKSLLGSPIGSKGLSEVDEAIDRLSRHSATARFISEKLVIFFVADDPSQALVNRVAATFTASDGDIAATLRTLFETREFKTSLGKKFKTPLQYVVSSIRLAYDTKPILNAGPMFYWLNRMGQPLFGRQTPDGYPTSETAWASPGQMTTRFEIAKAMGSGSAGLFKPEGLQSVEVPAFPQLASALFFTRLQPTLSLATRSAMDRAASPQEWNMLLLSSPEMMRR